MTNDELIDLVYEKSPGEFSPEELTLLRARMHDSNEIRLALTHRIQLEQGLVESLQPPPLPPIQVAEHIVHSLASGGAALQSLPAPAPNNGQTVEGAFQTARPSTGKTAAKSTGVPSSAGSTATVWGFRACLSVIVISAVALVATFTRHALRDGRPAEDKPQPAPVQPGDNAEDANAETNPEEGDGSPSDTVPPGFER